MNLALILVVLTALSGAVVAYDKFGRRRNSDLIRDADSPRENILVEYSRSFFPVLLFVLVIRSFIFEPFRIPSGSMMPTLLQGDYIFVKKYAYGLRLPVLETKILETGQPERGDVVVFRLPSDPSVNYIKRVVGLPGDEVVYRGHELTINGTPVTMARDSADASHDGIPRFIETLGEREHAILIARPENTMADGVYVVPEGTYFVMGDNRDNSRDSRYIGPIPETHLVGEAVRIWMHMDGLEWPSWGRIGTRIQ
ncbi:MAG: signal peptidase I [Gammaproteobacteria bacterium]|nr:signal peptidase I [Gammaproteobacteria bacterium]MDH4252899.1 signal peptidase I [Gammaproteobacteria bacterium]MDH5308415.1 signal peptidase I [Gammaproteobacteria bacterium]